MPVLNIPMVNMPTMFTVRKSDGSTRDFRTMEESQAWMNGNQPPPLTIATGHDDDDARPVIVEIVRAMQDCVPI